MLAPQDVLGGDDCPCSSTLLGALYRATPDQYEGVIESIPLDVRAVLALYCYRRAHLQAIGLAIAATCEESDLRVHGQSAGSALFHRARQIHQDPLPSAFRVRKTVTLSLGALKHGVFDEKTDEVVEPFDDLPASPNVQQDSISSHYQSGRGTGDYASTEPEEPSGLVLSARTAARIVPFDGAVRPSARSYRHGAGPFPLFPCAVRLVLPCFA